MDQATFGLTKEIGLQVLLDVTRAEEDQGLGNGMKCHVKEHAQNTQWPAEAEGKNHDPAVVDAGVSQKAPEAPLDQNERHRDSHRKQAEHDQKLRGKLRTYALGSQDIEPHQAVE